MKDIPFEYADLRLPRETQIRRMQSVIERELTECQREILMQVYFGGKTQAQVARERGVSRAAVCRTLARARARVCRFLRY